MNLFSSDDEKRISEAITLAESKTAGEIVAVVAPEAESYLYAPFLAASLVALLVPWPFIYLTWHSVQWIYLVQLLVFAGVVALFMAPGRRLWLVPRSVTRMHAHRRAVEQFMVQNLRTTEGRTGVLIFVSLAERYAEIVAERQINHAVPEGTWQGIVDRMTAELSAGTPTEAFVHAIEACGEHLAKHFPPGSSNKNELPNHLIVLT